MTTRHNMHLRSKVGRAKLQPVELMGKTSGSGGWIVGVFLFLEELFAEVTVCLEVGVGCLFDVTLR